MKAKSAPPSASAEPFSWTNWSGDFILRVRVGWHGETGGLVRAGWRARGSFGSIEASVADNGVARWRYTSPSSQNETSQVLAGADILELARQGRFWRFSVARRGEPFSVIFCAETSDEAGVETGLFYSPENTSPAPAFHDIRLTRPAAPDFRPYHDYIGSRLEILDVVSGQLDVVHTSPEAFEAPNWMPDDRTLILNISGPGPNKGTLKTFDLETGAVARLDTGFAVHNNNDHVLSFDSSRLAISHHSDDDAGRSVIYTLPARGGAPVRVTPRSPSFLHGWSPDAKWLVYTGGRSPGPGQTEKFDIYKIPSEGGDEIRLTTSPGLNDGPEFSPDGKYIYFNSTRSGLMQLWRMRPDGSQQERVTHDEFNNWFAHPSPDGKWIVFLSYGQDVAPAEHPYYRHVYLRLMPASGGPARVIAYVYGGQGTLNVPSWSRDSRRIAFVSNSDFL